MHGWRARVGMLLPSVNTAAEPQAVAMAPDGVSFHTARLTLKGAAESDIMGMVERLEEAAALVADARVDLIVFHCTAVSMHRPGFDDEIVERIEAATGIPATATSRAVLAAFRKIGARRIVLTTPYVQETNDREVSFLDSHRISVLSETGMGIAADAEKMIAVPPGEWYRRVKAQRDDAADAYFVSCTAIRAVEAIEPLERDLDRPVVTSNQAMVWHCLERLGIGERVPGYGRLMAADGAG